MKKVSKCIGLHWSKTATDYFHNTLDYRILLYILPGPIHPARVVVPPKHPLTQPTELQKSQGDLPPVVHWRPSAHTMGNINYYISHIYSNKWKLRCIFTFIYNPKSLTCFPAKAIIWIIRIINASQTWPFTGLYSLSTWARRWTLLTNCARAPFNTLRPGRFTLLTFFQGTSFIWKFNVYIWSG